MPLYEYLCSKCGHRFEKIESHTASAKKKCPKCGARADRVHSAPAIQFKGSGWYATDYGGKSSDGGSKQAESSTEKSTETSKEKGQEVSKPEPAKESAPKKKKEKE